MVSIPPLHELIAGLDNDLAGALRATAHMDRRPPPLQKITRYLLVSANPLPLAIAIDGLAEVGPLPAVTHLPNLPPWIVGIVNVRGEILSLVDVSRFLGLSNAVPAQGRRLVVVRHDRRKVGLRVDRIGGAVSCTAADIGPAAPPPVEALVGPLFTGTIVAERVLYHVFDVRCFLAGPRFLNYNSAT